MYIYVCCGIIAGVVNLIYFLVASCNTPKLKGHPGIGILFGLSFFVLGLSLSAENRIICTMSMLFMIPGFVIIIICFFKESNAGIVIGSILGSIPIMVLFYITYLKRARVAENRIICTMSMLFMIPGFVIIIIGFFKESNAGIVIGSILGSIPIMVLFYITYLKRARVGILTSFLIIPSIVFTSMVVFIHQRSLQWLLSICSVCLFIMGASGFIYIHSQISKRLFLFTPTCFALFLVLFCVSFTLFISFYIHSNVIVRWNYFGISIISAFFCITSLADDSVNTLLDRFGTEIIHGGFMILASICSIPLVFIPLITYYSSFREWDFSIMIPISIGVILSFFTGAGWKYYQEHYFSKIPNIEKSVLLNPLLSCLFVGSTISWTRKPLTEEMKAAIEMKELAEKRVKVEKERRKGEEKKKKQEEKLRKITEKVKRRELKRRSLKREKIDKKKEKFEKKRRKHEAKLAKLGVIQEKTQLNTKPISVSDEVSSTLSSSSVVPGSPYVTISAPGEHKRKEDSMTLTSEADIRSLCIIGEGEFGQVLLVEVQGLKQPCVFKKMLRTADKYVVKSCR
ncbi:hypothetical protein ADUPG1_014217, partial [Aduncisulcus paluster]